MKEIQKTLKHLAIMNGFIVLGIFFNIEVIPFIFPFRHLSTFYFLTLSILLVFYYDRRVVSRKGHRILMLAIGAMPSEAALLLFELFENLLEINFLSMKACYVTLTHAEGQVDCKINLEGKGMICSSLRVPKR